MLKRLVIAAALCCAALPARAGWYSDVGMDSRGYHRWHRQGEPVHGIASSHDCHLAARLGGPCGCTVANLLGLPHVYHGINLWLARAWYHFARTFPHPGAVAIWGTHHVELVSAVHNGRFDSVGSVGHRNVPVSRVAFVQPPGTRM